MAQYFAKRVVSSNKLVKQLRREISAHPKKAAALGLLALVALWFWAPLVWGWIGSQDTETATEVEPVADGLPAQPPGPISNLQPTPKKEEKTESPRHPWQKLVKWMEDDWRTSAANVVSSRRDPFRTPKPEVAESQPKDETPEPDQQEVTPESLGLVLSGTAVGPRRRVAQIGGKTFRIGTTISVTKDGQQYQFTLVEVHSDRVVLERNAKRFELKIPTTGSSDRIELYGSTN